MHNNEKTGRPGRGRRIGNFLRECVRDRDKYAMLLPFFILYGLFTLAPIVYSIVLSLTDFNMLSTPHFVWLDNYRKLLLEDSVFPTVVKNTLLFAVVTGPISYFLCLLVAWLVNELSPVPRAAMTFLFYAPNIAGNLYVVWSMIFSGDMYGWANGFLMNLGQAG